MRQFLKILIRGALVLTAVTVMLTTVQAQAAPINDQDQVQRWPAVTDSQPATFLLAQNAETLKQKPPSPAPSPNEPKKFRKRAAPPPAQMERQDSKSPVFGDDPERAGTKKLGGQIIRGQEGPGGE
jgi:hypothetical protein